MLWTECNDAREAGRLPRPSLNKLETSELARRLGLRTARILAVHDDPRELDFSRLPERFVLKPTVWWSRMGVMMLSRSAASAELYDTLGRRSMSPEAVIAEQDEWMRKWRSRPRQQPYRLIAEEWVRDEDGAAIPLDYKLYAFDGDIRLIVQMDRNHASTQVAFFIDAFQIPRVLSTYLVSDWKLISPGAHRLPRCHAQMIDAAATISKALCTPFVSVDTYASADGAVIGELTTTPGGPRAMWRFTPWFDRELGRAWLLAEQRLAERAASACAGHDSAAGAPPVDHDRL